MHSVKNSMGYMVWPSHGPLSSLCHHCHVSLGTMPRPKEDGLNVFLGSTLDPTTTHSFPLLFSPSCYCALLLASVLCFSLLFSTSCCCALLATVLCFLLLCSPCYCSLLLTTVLSLLLCSPSHYCALLTAVLSFSLLCSPCYCALLLATVLSFSLLFSPSCYCSLLLAAHCPVVVSPCIQLLYLLCSVVKF